MKPLTAILLLLIASTVYSQNYIDLSTADSIRIVVSERNPNIGVEKARSALRHHLKQSCQKNAARYFIKLDLPNDPDIEASILRKITLDIKKGIQPDETILSVNRAEVERILLQKALSMMNESKSHFEQIEAALKHPSGALKSYIQALDISRRIPVVPSDTLSGYLTKLTDSAEDFFKGIIVTRPQSIILPEGEPFDAKLRIYYRGIQPMPGIAFIVNDRRVGSDRDGYVRLSDQDNRNSSNIRYRIDLDEKYSRLIDGSSGEIEIHRLLAARALYQTAGEFPASIRSFFRTMGIESTDSDELATHIVTLDIIRVKQEKPGRFAGFVAVIKGTLTLKEKSGKVLREWKTGEIEAFSTVSEADAGVKARELAVRNLESKLMK